MAGLLTTNLRIVSAQIPPDFSGTVQDFQRALVERLQILSTTGSTAFVVGDIEPPTDQGPWLRGGSQWWVFDPNLGRYVPLDISASITALFTVSETEPAAPDSDDAQIWLRTKSNRVLGWYFWDGTEWRPDGQTPPSGPTSERPTDPGDLETFFDTDISVLLHFERGAWRTVSGSPGDIKFVSTPILAEALTRNPGWFFAGETDQDMRGRALGFASKDPGATPAISYPTDAGITARAQGDVVGVETVTLADAQIPQHTHLVGAITVLNVDNNAFFYRVDDSETFVAPGDAPPNHARINGEGTSDGTLNGQLPATAAGTMFVTSKQLTEVIAPDYTDPSAAHDNMPPTKYLWALEKQ